MLLDLHGRQRRNHRTTTEVRTWICEAGRLKQNVVESTLPLHQLLDGGNSEVLDAATQTAVREFEHLFRHRRSRVIWSGDIDSLCYKTQVEHWYFLRSTQDYHRTFNVLMYAL